MISKYKIVRKNFLSFLSGWTMYMYILTRRIPALEFSTRKLLKYRLCILETMILVLFCPSLLFGSDLSDEGM
jgi:hypothetical protein